MKDLLDSDIEVQTGRESGLNRRKGENEVRRSQRCLGGRMVEMDYQIPRKRVGEKWNRDSQLPGLTSQVPKSSPERTSWSSQ